MPSSPFGNSSSGIIVSGSEAIGAKVAITIRTIISFVTEVRCVVRTPSYDWMSAPPTKPRRRAPRRDLASNSRT